MLTHPTSEKLHSLRLLGMVKALDEQRRMPEIQDLSFEERLGLLVDREVTERDNRRLSSRLRKAKLRLEAAVEDIAYRPARGLDKSLMLALSSCRWIDEHLNILITGKTGVGKSYIACALAQKACREGHSALYFRLPRLLQELALARADGRYGKLLATLAKTDVVVLDDFGLGPLTDEQRRDLLEMFDDRHGNRSTIVTSQLPVKNWHEALGDPTLADAILDRLVHNAHRIPLEGESMRKKPKT
jgi:DNA replication protein DnaC